MDEFYFKALNGSGNVAMKNGKPILYKRTPYCGCKIEFDNTDIEIEIQKSAGFKAGWCELENFWVVEPYGRESKEFKKFSQLGQN
jgi:hypothetical protein